MCAFLLPRTQPYLTHSHDADHAEHRDPKTGSNLPHTGTGSWNDSADAVDVSANPSLSPSPYQGEPRTPLAVLSCLDLALLPGVRPDLPLFSASIPTLTNSQSHLHFCHNAIRSNARFCAHSGGDTHASTLDFQSHSREAAYGSLPRVPALANPVYSKSFKHSGRSTLVYTIRLYYHKLGFSLLERVVEACERGKGKRSFGLADCTSLCICLGKDCDPGSDGVCGVFGVGTRRGHIGIG